MSLNVPLFLPPPRVSSFLLQSHHVLVYSVSHLRLLSGPSHTFGDWNVSLQLHPELIQSDTIDFAVRAGRSRIASRKADGSLLGVSGLTDLA